MRKLIPLAVVLYAVAAHAQTAQITVNQQNRTIQVTASADAEQMADVANVSIGFQVYGPDEQAAYAKGSERSNAIARALADAGVKKDDMQSENQNLSATPVYDEQQKKLGAFQVSQSWTVKCSATSAANILHIAVLAGANNSGNINWDVADPDTLQGKAAARALQRAREQARTMAAGLDVRLGMLIYASNEAPDQVGPRPMMRAMAGLVANKAPVPLAINPQKITKSATVTAIFAIE